MKEILAGETFNKTYIAIPIRESPLYDWIRKINDHKNFYHMTIFYIGDIDNNEKIRIVQTMKSLPTNTNNSLMVSDGLGFIGERKDTFVLKIKNNEYLANIRDVFEKSLSENTPQLPFFPHITIEQAKKYGFNKKEIKGLLGISDISHLLPPYPVNTIGLYYRTEEGATALLFSKKL